MGTGGRTAATGSATGGAATLAALLLGDGRFPAGGHAHSAGAESACADGRIVDVGSLAAFVEGRVRTTGLVDASLAAATVVVTGACTGPDVPRALATLQAEADARITPPPLRAASRKLGRQLLRVAGRCWPDPTLAVLAEAVPGGAHQSVVLGAVGVAAGLDVDTVAHLAVHHALTTPGQAAVRLLGLDPFEVAALTARMGPTAAQVAGDAVAAAQGLLGEEDLAGGQDVGGGHDLVDGTARPHDGRPDRPRSTRGAGLDAVLARLAELPAAAGPLVEVAAVHHRSWDVRMFAT